jgi:hypothetical protein
VKESTARPEIISQQPKAFQYQEATYWILILLEVGMSQKNIAANVIC